MKTKLFKVYVSVLQLLVVRYNTNQSSQQTFAIRIVKVRLRLDFLII